MFVKVRNNKKLYQLKKAKKKKMKQRNGLDRVKL